MNILIVDDDMIIRNGMKQIILQNIHEKYSILEADNGLLALRLLLESDISLVFVDIRMPVMDGIRLLEVAVPLFPDASFIVISAYGEFEYAQKAMRLGAIDYLLKPINSEDLIILVQDKLSNSSSNHMVKTFSDLSYKLRPDMEEALRLFITKGIYTDFICNSLPVELTCKSLNIVVIDVNKGYEYDISLLNTSIIKSLGNFPGKIYWFESTPPFLLISSNSLIHWLDYLNSILNRKDNFYNIGISSSTSSLADLPKCYYEAKEALQYRLIVDGNIFHYKPRTSIECKIDEQLYKLILLTKKSSLSIQKDIKSVIDHISESCRISPGSFFTLIDQFCLKFTASSIKSENQISYKLDVDYILDQMRLVRSKDEIANQIEGFIGEIARITNFTSIDYYGQVIKQVKQYIQDHLTEDITLDMVADFVKLSSAHLSRLFHKITGINFITYLTDLRLEEGKKLLGSGKYLIYEVADKVGYSSWKHFSRLFRQKYGLTPNEYLGKNNK